MGVERFGGTLVGGFECRLWPCTLWSLNYLGSRQRSQTLSGEKAPPSSKPEKTQQTRHNSPSLEQVQWRTHSDFKALEFSLPRLDPNQMGSKQDGPTITLAFALRESPGCSPLSSLLQHGMWELKATEFARGSTCADKHTQGGTSWRLVSHP